MQLMALPAEPKKPEKTVDLGCAIVGGLCFLLALFLLIFVLGDKICGVSFFSPQVSWSDRFQGLMLPAIPAALGILIIWLGRIRRDR
jgi:hypothetical protein